MVQVNNNLAESKEDSEISAEKIAKINAYRSKCLEEYMPKVLSSLVQEYDPIEDKWKCETTLVGSEYVIRGVCPFQENKLISCSGENIIRIWDIVSGKCETTLCGHTKPLNNICLLPKNKLESASYDKTIKIWDLKSGQCEKPSYDVNPDTNKGLCILSGNKLCSGSLGGIISIKGYDYYESYKIPFSIDGICYLAEKNKLIVYSREKKIIILDISSDVIETAIALDTKEPVTALCSLPGNKIAFGSERGKIQIFDLESWTY